MNLDESPDLTAPGVAEGREESAALVSAAVASDAPAGREFEPDVLLGNLVFFEPTTSSAPSDSGLAPVMPGGVSVSFESPVESVLGAEVDPPPDVPLGSLVVFERIDRAETRRHAFESLTEVEDYVPEPSPAINRAIVREWAESLAIVLAIILVFTGYVAQATQVPTGSMKPTILVGDHFFIEKLAFPGNYPAAVRPYLPQRAVRRGDIIVFRSPVDRTTPYVKRVIGTPGDRVEVRRKDVFVNDVKLEEPYKIHVKADVYSNDAWTPEDGRKRDNYGPVIVPQDSFFVMGDNRDDSNDSRYWGFVSRDAIMGMPLFVYWSYRSEAYTGATPTIKERLNDYVSTAIHFFSRTRWFRFGTIVQ